MVRTAKVERQHKHLVLDQAKLKKAQKLLGARTETETIDRALEQVINEEETSRRAWLAHDRFIREAILNDVKIEDAFGHLDND
jgi:hypothetical protein